MRLLIVTDAWHPQVNGVVRTLNMTADCLRARGIHVEFLTPDGFRTLPMPGYAGMRVAVPLFGQVAGCIRQARADHIHVATEGPLGLAARNYCKRKRLPLTTSFHTRFPDYISARFPVPASSVWRLMRWFHSASNCVMAATPALIEELRERGFENVALWPRGVDTKQFYPRDVQTGFARPVFLSVGRVAIEKNLEVFLKLDLPGTKIVVGDGPARAQLENAYPDVKFFGELAGEDLARAYASADVFVFPSKTDTYGLVLLEALASGVPVAAHPVTGPKDVIGEAPVGVLREDLREACLMALEIDREQCLSFAKQRSWEASAAAFADNIVRAHLQDAVEHVCSATLEPAPRQV